MHLGGRLQSCKKENNKLNTVFPRAAASALRKVYLRLQDDAFSRFLPLFAAHTMNDLIAHRSRLMIRWLLVVPTVILSDGTTMLSQTNSNNHAYQRGTQT